MKKIMFPAFAMVMVYALVYLHQTWTNQTTKSSKLGTKKHILASLEATSKHPLPLQDHNNNFTHKKTVSVKTKQSEKTSFIKPPVPSRNIAYESYLFDAENGTRLTYKTGTVITIPPHCFVDKKGNLVSGKVKLNYREFNKPSEIFLCGIPMQWNKTEYLESGGMLDIQVSQGDELLSILPGKSIEIAMRSKFTDDDYNLYKFDDEAGKWIDLGKSYVQTIVENNAPSTENERNNIQETRAKRISLETKTTVSLQNMVGFGIDMDDEYRADDQTIYRYASLRINGYLKYFPELKKLNQYKFRITSHTYSELLRLGFTGEKAMKFVSHQLPQVRDHKYYKDTINGKWMYHDVRLNIPGKKGFADLIFINSERSDTFGVVPSIKGKTEQKKFLRRYDAYASMVDSCSYNRNNFQTATMTYYKDFNEIDTSKLSKNELERLKVIKKEIEVERRFNITDLTFYNCDRPFPITPNKMYFARFSEQNVPNISYPGIYCAFTNRNSVISLNGYYYHFPEFPYYLWAVKDENTVAYLTPDDIRQLQINYNKQNNIKLKLMNMDEFLHEMDRVILSNVQYRPLI